MTKNFTIGIVGAGAVGLTYAALLSEVAIIKVKTHRHGQAEAINARGLVFVRRDDTEKTYKDIAASDDYHILADCDAVIVAVKSYDTEQVARALDDVIKPEAVILSLQNGLQAFGVLKETMSNPSRVYGGVSYVVASRIDDRKVLNGNMLRSVVDQNAGELANIMQSSPFEAELSPNIKQAMWDKMVLNTGQNALSAITNLKFGEMYQSADCLEIATKLTDELRAVGEAEGLTFDYSMVEKLKDNWKGSSFLPSMWQDLHNGRRTEIDAINGSISRIGKKHGIATPYNDMVSSLIRALEGATPSEIVEE
ncbi:2-dehydropantoate 2-reductase [Candidatus Saccharibacteria bacterium]|nr:2-dehydropantoate 2-reductase [Candidatus Saccharibacteria bacterium]